MTNETHAIRLEKAMRRNGRLESDTRARRRGTESTRLSEEGESGTHLPPAIAKEVVLLEDLDALAGTKGNLVVVLWGKVVSGIDVFHHGKCR
jgi:hypothetical protein